MIRSMLADVLIVLAAKFLGYSVHLLLTRPPRVSRSIGGLLHYEQMVKAEDIARANRIVAALTVLKRGA